MNDSRRERAIRKDNRKEGKNVKIAKRRSEDSRDRQELLLEQGRKEKDGKTAETLGRHPKPRKRKLTTEMMGEECAEG